jgi:hypothetical protein
VGVLFEVRYRLLSFNDAHAAIEAAEVNARLLERRL